MINVQGLYRFKDFFERYSDRYVLIGGTACSIIFDEVGENFRTTKDLDIVLIVENINAEFGRDFWNFIKEGHYSSIETGQEKRQFYRFKMPEDPTYPFMIELFSRSPNLPLLPGAHLAPLHIADDISSLSAILLNDEYYSLLLTGRRMVEGFSVLDEKYLIPFKIKACCDLYDRRLRGEKGHSKHIKKHYRDIYHLLMLLPQSIQVPLSETIRNDIVNFLTILAQPEFYSEDIDNAVLADRLQQIYLS